MSPPPPPPEELIEQVEVLRAKAARMRIRADEVNDAIQETLVVGLQRGPHDPSRLGAWLRSVFLNSVRQSRRSSARRAAREFARSPLLQAESRSDVAAREQAVRRLVSAIRALPEEQAEAVALRYLDGLPPRKIAARLERPLATVKSRIARGLGTLRRTLG